MADSDNKLRELRLSKGISQEKLADLSGVDQASISRIENGKQPLLSENALRFKKVLGVETAELLGLSPSLTPRPAISKNLPVLPAKEIYKLIDSKVRIEQLKSVATVTTSMDHSVMSFALRIEDDSMEPEFKEGHVIIVDPDKLEKVRPGSFVVAATKYKTAVFMQYKLEGFGEDGRPHFRLHPLNDSYPALDSLRDELVLIGLAVEHNRPI